MARQRGQRRGSGFRTPELRGTLGTLINTALSQAGVVRDALERGAREGRSRLDEVRAGRRRHDALAELGELVLELIRSGEIDLDELPEARALVRQLDDLDGDPDGVENHELDAVARPASRRRFDERGADDGTVSSNRTWSPKPPAGASRVWRPVAADDADADPAPPAPPRRTERPTLPNNPSRKGGIAFDDDDLAEYMHPDDIPPKPRDDD